MKRVIQYRYRMCNSISLLNTSTELGPKQLQYGSFLVFFSLDMLQTKYKIQSLLLSSVYKNIIESLNCFYTLQITNYAMLIYFRGVCFV